MKLVNNKNINNEEIIQLLGINVHDTIVRASYCIKTS